MARQLVRWFGDQQAADAASPQQMLEARGISPKVVNPIEQKMAVLRDAYLTVAGHKRPGIRAGLPLDEALKKARALSAQIRQLSKQ